MRSVADTDFLSAFIKINKVELIYEALDADKIYITQAVLEEIAKAPFFNDFKRQMGKIELVVLDIVSFLLLCKEIDLLRKNDIEHIINLLKKYDYMEFSQEQKILLLE